MLVSLPVERRHIALASCARSASQTASAVDQSARTLTSSDSRVVCCACKASALLQQFEVVGVLSRDPTTAHAKVESLLGAQPTLYALGASIRQTNHLLGFVKLIALVVCSNLETPSLICVLVNVDCRLLGA